MTLEVINIAILALTLAVFIFDSTHDKRHYEAPALKQPLSDFLLFLWLGFVVFLAGQLVASFIASNANPKHWLLIGTLCTHIPILLLVLFGRYIPGTVYPSPLDKPDAGNPLPPALRYVVSGFFLTAMVALGWGALLQKFGGNMDLKPQDILLAFGQVDSALTLFLLMVVAVVVAPIWEEVIFRGTIYRYLKTRMKPIFALTITSLLFACAHFNVLAFLPLFLLGMLLGRSYEKTGSIKVPILYHAIFNLTTVLTLLFLPNDLSL